MTRALALTAALAAVPLVGEAAGKQGARPSTPIVLLAPRSFDDGVAAIERATGAKGEAFEGASGKIPLAQGRCFALDGHTAERLLDGSHRVYLKAGLYLFRYERSFGVAGERDRVGLLPTANRNDVIRLVVLSSPHGEVTSERLIAWLDALAKDEPFDLREIGVDYVAGRFARKPKDPRAIAQRSAEFTPDLVAGRASTLDLLAEEIRVNRTLYLIW